MTQIMTCAQFEVNLRQYAKEFSKLEARYSDEQAQHVSELRRELSGAYEAMVAKKVAAPDPRVGSLVEALEGMLAEFGGFKLDCVQQARAALAAAKGGADNKLDQSASEVEIRDRETGFAKRGL